jgi:hypothetical protein
MGNLLDNFKYKYFPDKYTKELFSNKNQTRYSMQTKVWNIISSDLSKFNCNLNFTILLSIQNNFQNVLGYFSLLFLILYYIFFCLTSTQEYRNKSVEM